MNTPHTNGPLHTTCTEVISLVEACTNLLGRRHHAVTTILRGGAWVNRERVRSLDAMLLPTMQVVVHTPPDHARPCHLDEGAILYHDRWLLAIDKPAGTYVDATPWDADNQLRQTLADLWYRLHHQPLKLHPAHRLDRDTTGVLLFSHHAHANPAIQKLFVTHAVHKTYICHVHGWVPWTEHTIHTGHGRSDRGRFRVYPYDDIGQRLPNGDNIKAMSTRFMGVHHQSDGTSIMLAQPISGRTHQIRLHASELGHPLVGDKTYGHSDDSPPHHLHAWRLQLPHPIHHTPLLIQAPLPPWCPPDLAERWASDTIHNDDLDNI